MSYAKDNIKKYKKMQRAEYWYMAAEAGTALAIAIFAIAYFSIL